MSGLRWVRVTLCENVPPREGRAVRLGTREIAIFNLGDRFHAIDNRCPHSGGPLCDGIVSGRSVVCPLHAWKINLEDGSVERPAGGGATGVTAVAAYPVRVERGVVEVGLPVAASDLSPTPQTGGRPRSHSPPSPAVRGG